MALNSLYCADVPLSNYSLTHSLRQTVARQMHSCHTCWIWFHFYMGQSPMFYHECWQNYACCWSSIQKLLGHSLAHWLLSTWCSWFTTYNWHSNTYLSLISSCKVVGWVVALDLVPTGCDCLTRCWSPVRTSVLIFVMIFAAVDLASTDATSEVSGDGSDFLQCSGSAPETCECLLQMLTWRGNCFLV